MGGVASGCCMERGCFSDNKDQENDPVKKNAPSLEQKTRAVAVPTAAPSDVFIERDVVFQNSESDVCAKASPQLNSHPSMTVVFQKQGGSTQFVKFTERPVGLNFGPAAHWSREVKKIAPGSHAEAVGVKPGWAILTINGESLVGADDETIHTKFGDAVSVLSFPKSMINRRSSWDDLSSPNASTRSPASSVCSLPIK